MIPLRNREALADGLPDAELVVLEGREHAQPAPFRGDEVVTTGDGFLAAFGGPARAVRCGMALQESTGGDLSVRIGVHTAEVERPCDDIAGVGVHIGARVTSAATPARCGSRERCATWSPVPGSRASASPGSCTRPARERVTVHRYRQPDGQFEIGAGDGTRPRGGEVVATLQRRWRSDT